MAQGSLYEYHTLWEDVVFVVKKYFLKIFCSLAHFGIDVKYIVLYMCIIYVCFRVTHYLFLCPLLLEMFVCNYLIFNVVCRGFFVFSQRMNPIE